MPTIQLSGCAIIRNNKILLIRKKGKDFWELPGGVVTSKDAVEQTAVEKTKEQIGVAPVIVQQFTVLEYQINEKNAEATIFECDLEPESEIVPGTGVDVVEWLEISDLGKENIGEDVKAIIEEL